MENRTNFNGSPSLAVIGETAYARASRVGKPRTFFSILHLLRIIV
jgi:hypothetical protein